jgi:hypothetical protein
MFSRRNNASVEKRKVRTSQLHKHKYLKNFSFSSYVFFRDFLFLERRKNNDEEFFAKIFFLAWGWLASSVDNFLVQVYCVRGKFEWDFLYVEIFTLPDHSYLILMVAKFNEILLTASRALLCLLARLNFTKRIIEFTERRDSPHNATRFSTSKSFNLALEDFVIWRFTSFGKCRAFE